MKTHHYNFSFWISFIFILFLISCSRNNEIATKEKTTHRIDNYADSILLSPKIFKTFFTSEYDFSHVKQTSKPKDLAYLIKTVSSDGKSIRTAIKYKNKQIELDDKLNAYLIVEGSIESSIEKKAEMKRFLLIINGSLPQDINLFSLNLNANNVNYIDIKKENKISKSSFLRITSSTKSTASKLALPCGNMDPVCIDYYWIEYDSETGEIYSETYLYTFCEDCNESGGGGGGTIGEEDETCNNSDLDAEIYETSITRNSFLQNQNTTKRKMQYTWQFAYDGSFDYYSTEQGTHKKVGNEWHWESLEHLNTDMEGFSFGITTTIENVSATGMIHSARMAYMDFRCQIRRYLVCKGFPINKKFTKSSYSPVWDSNVNY